MDKGGRRRLVERGKRVSKWELEKKLGRPLQTWERRHEEYEGKCGESGRRDGIFQSKREKLERERALARAGKSGSE